MSIKNMRSGDTIFAKDASAIWIVDEVEFDSCTAYDSERAHKTKVFKADSLECVDADDGVWQEMEN